MYLQNREDGENLLEMINQQLSAKISTQNFKNILPIEC